MFAILVSGRHYSNQCSWRETSNSICDWMYGRCWYGYVTFNYV